MRNLISRKKTKICYQKIIKSFYLIKNSRLSIFSDHNLSSSRHVLLRPITSDHKSFFSERKFNVLLTLTFTNNFFLEFSVLCQIWTRSMESLKPRIPTLWMGFPCWKTDKHWPVTPYSLNRQSLWPIADKFWHDMTQFLTIPVVLS